MSSPPACRASPLGGDEKSRLNWKFSRLSLPRFMSYLPLFSFGPSATVSGLTYPLLHLSVRSASLVLPTSWPIMPSADFCSAVRPPCGCLSRRSDTEQISRGKLSRLPCTIAGSTLRTFDGYGLRDKSLARPALAPNIRFLSIDPHVCYTLPSDPASRRQPLRFTSPSPPSVWAEDFHLQAAEHARHTTNPLARECAAREAEQVASAR
jgi:hypothetical protein